MPSRAREFSASSALLEGSWEFAWPLPVSASSHHLGWMDELNNLTSVFLGEALVQHSNTGTHQNNLGAGLASS